MEPNEHDKNDLDRLGQRLLEARPQMDLSEHERVRSRVFDSRRPSSAGLPLRSRLAVAFALAFGVFAFGGGSAIAVSALSETDSAAKGQYPPPPCDPEVEDCSGVLDETGGGTADEGDVSPGLRAGEQTASSGGDANGLPFTGFAAIPLLSVGLLSLGVGIMMARRLSNSR